MDEVVSGGAYCETIIRNGGLDAARRLALQHIDKFVQAFSDPHSLSLAAASWAPAVLLQVAESARITEAGHLRCRYCCYMGTCVV